MPPRCPKGSRRNKKTGECEKTGTATKQTTVKRCPKGTRRNKESGVCESTRMKTPTPSQFFEKLNYLIEKFANQTSKRTHTNQMKNMTEEEIARIRKHLLEREKLMNSIGDGKIKMSGLVNKLKMDIQHVRRLTQSKTLRGENVPELMRVSNKISMVGDMIDDTLEAIQTLEYDIDEDEEALEKLDATLQTLAESFGIEWDKLEQVGGDIGTLLRG